MQRPQANVLLCLLLVALFGHGASQQLLDLGTQLRSAIQSGRLVTLTGPAGFPTSPSIVIPSAVDIQVTSGADGRQTVDWRLPAAAISLSTGASLTLSNLTILLPEPLPSPPSASALHDAWPLLLKLPGIKLSPGSSVTLRNLVIQVDSCKQVQQVYQQAVCSAIADGLGGTSAWSAPQVLPGSVVFPARTSPPTASDGWSASDVSITCPQPTTTTNTTTTNTTNTTTYPSPPCLVQSISTADELRTGLLTAGDSVAPGGRIVLQLTTSISLSRTTWPVQGVRLVNPVILAGKPLQGWTPGSDGTEIDLANLPLFVTLDQSKASMSFTDLSIVNLPIGRDDVYPSSLLVGACWSVGFDRFSANRTMLLLQNSQIVIPQDLFNYLSWWTAAQSSLVPSLRDRAEWLKSAIYFGLSLGVADNHFLLFSRREGLGTLWINSTVTDLPFEAPLILAKTGIQDLATNDSNVALNKVQGIRTADQLLSALTSPDASKPYLVLLQGIKLDAAAAQRALSAANASRSSDGHLLFNLAVNVIGRTDAPPVYIDFGGSSSLFELAMPQGSRLTFQRLVLTGLGPAGPDSVPSGTPYPSLAGNVTSFLWPFHYQRKQPQLRLQDVTLLVPATELAAFQQALAPPVRQSSGATISANVATALQTLWPVANVVSSNDTSLLLSDIAYAGLDGSLVRLTSVVPPWLSNSNITLPTALPLGVPPTASDSSSSSTNLSAGTIGGIVAAVIVALLASMAGLYFWNERVHALKQQVDIERGEKVAALQQVHNLVSARNTPAGSNTSKDPGSLEVFHRDVNGTGSQAHAAHAASNSHSTSYPSVHTSNHTVQDVGTMPATANRASGSGQPSTASSREHLPGGVHGPSRLSGVQKAAGGSSNPSPGSSVGRLALDSQQPVPNASLVRGSHDLGDLTSEQPGGAAVSGLLGPPLVVVAENVPLDAVALAADTGSSITSSGARKPGSKSSSMDAKRVLLNKGLAAGDDDEEPESVLQQIINQRKEMQGIDMQQVEFQQVLGQGSFGVVYKGRWRSLTVAIKTLMFQDAGATKRIRQRAITEAAINTLLSHDNIINTYTYDLRPVAGSGMPDDKHAAHWKLYIIQEFCDGGSLSQAIDKGMFMDPHTKKANMVHVLQIAEDIAKGMAYIHAANVIHGDLSSGNIMLRFEPRVASCFQAKVGDFGLSRFLEGPEHSHISNARQGTPFYIAPEVMTQGIISKDADVFSFGVLLWEMFCGTPPWRDPALVAMRHTLNPRTYPYHVPMSCPSEYHAIIMACLAEQPKARPRFAELQQHISDLLKMLKHAILMRGQRPAQEQTPGQGQGGVRGE